MAPFPRPAVASGALGVLFAEDFDEPPGVTILDDDADSEPDNDPARAPEQIVRPAIDLEAERADAFARGRDAALADIAATTANQMGEHTRLLAEIAARLADSEAVGRARAEQSADAIARLLLGSIACVLPAACAHHGDGEVVALARTVLPALSHAPKVTIQAHAETMRALDRLLETLEPRLRGRIRLSAADRIPVGDVRIAWADGEATRDTAAIWRDVTAVLARIGLFEPLAAG